ncbi:MAG: hypothetical protein K2F91_00745 [Muribaculaceae bacterium]|nr:hypothetical protein [Muribaculaceae bacterium]
MKKLILIAIIIVIELLHFDCRADYYRTARIRNAEIQNEEIVGFIKDVIIPLAKSINFTPRKDDIFLEFNKREKEDIIDVDITLYKDLGFNDYDGKFDVGDRQYVAYIDSFPVFISSYIDRQPFVKRSKRIFRDNPYIHVLDKSSDVRMITHTGLVINDACVSWRFKFVKGELIYIGIEEWTNWFEDVDRSTLKPSHVHNPAPGEGNYYYTAPIRNAEIQNEEIVDFIQDVIIPLAKSIEFTPLRDDIFIQFYKTDNDTIDVVVVLHKDCGFTDYYREFDVGPLRQYVTYIDSFPVFISSYKDNPSDKESSIDFKNNPYLRVLDKSSDVRMITHTVQSKNDACVLWGFSLVDGELIYNGREDRADWFKNYEPSLLKPNKLRVKRIKAVPTGEVMHPFRIE